MGYNLAALLRPGNICAGGTSRSRRPNIVGAVRHCARDGSQSSALRVGHALRSSQTTCCSWLPCCAGTNEGSGRLSHNEIRYCLPQTGLSSTMGDLITAPAAHVEARSQNAGLVITRTISTRRDDAHRTSPTLTPSAGASSELANRHSHLPVGRALEEQLFLPPAARGIASFAAVCAAKSVPTFSNYLVGVVVNGLLG